VQGKIGFCSLLTGQQTKINQTTSEEPDEV
jgi:hypothetical protein